MQIVLGLSLSAFTELHVVISLIGIVAGLVFFAVLGNGRWLSQANGLFLVFTILTSITGFLFPPKPFGPAHLFGAISLVALAIGLYALYGRQLIGWWRAVYLVTALLAQWLNMVVLVVQSYQKVPSLHALAPTGSEPVVLATQALVLALIVAAGWRTLFRRI